MAKSKTKSKTIVFNTVSGIVCSILLGIEAASDLLRGVMPVWGYVLMMIVINAWNAWRRTVTTEPVE